MENGYTSSLLQPAPQYYTTNADKFYNIKLVVQNDHNCFDTSVQKLKAIYTCYIAVPNAFTPNGDGKNDYLYPLNAYKADHLEFKVYNRFGQLFYTTKDWTKKWNGTVDNDPQPSGVYVWTLRYTHHDTGQKYFLKGATVLVR